MMIKSALRHSKAKTSYLLVSIVLTLGLPFSAYANQGLCSSIFETITSSAFHLFQNNLVEKTPNESAWDKLITDRVSPYYKNAWDRNFNQYYHRDFIEYKEKRVVEMEILGKLGFEISQDKITAPDFNTFVDKYENYLNSHKVPEVQRIRPAVLFRKKENTDDILLKVPHKERWTENIDEWKTTADVRIKPRQMAQALADGRYPVFYDGAHDVFHLITFALYPEYAQALRDGHARLAAGKVGGGFLHRTSYFLEVLTLADPQQLKTIKSHLTIKDISQQEVTIRDFENAVNKLSEIETWEKVQFWLANFQSFLRHYAGGMAEPRERNIYNNRKSINDIKAQFYAPTGSASKVTLAAILPDGMSHMDSQLNRLVNERIDISLSSRATTENLAEIESMIRRQVARMEYALWASATKINVNQWAADTLGFYVDPSSPTMQFIKDAFGENSATYRGFTQ